jgi:hypothetical protein
VAFKPIRLPLIEVLIAEGSRQSLDLFIISTGSGQAKTIFYRAPNCASKTTIKAGFPVHCNFWNWPKIFFAVFVWSMSELSHD